MKRLLLLLTLALPMVVIAAPQFPVLSGRVVDEAGILSPAVEQTLIAQLAALEQKNGDQLVVVTLKSLQGYSIEDYGYQLGRHWGIGQAGKDNGVLLIVAPKERKVRIEVGYGLEGTLTDALTSVIIQTRIIPAFKSGDMEQGVVLGTSAILDVLGGNQAAVAEMQTSAKKDTGDVGVGWIVFVAFALGQLFRGITHSRILGGLVGGGVGFGLGMMFAGLGVAIFFALFLFMFNVGFASGGRHSRYYGGGGWGGGGFGGGGGGFSGGGGGFGGGGSSGSW